MAYYSVAGFEPDISVGYLAKRIFQLTSVGLEPLLAEDGTTLTQWSALVSIHYGRGRTCAELARDLSYDKGAATRLVDALEAKGWVLRERASDDRRMSRLTLTDEGERVAQHCRDRVIDRWNDWLADWPRERVDALVALLQQLRTDLQERIEGEASA